MLKKVQENKSQKNKPIKKDNDPGFSFKIKNNKHVPGGIIVSRKRLVMNDGIEKNLT